MRVLVRGQPAKSLSVSLRLPPAHEEWVKRQRRASGLRKLARKRHTVHFRALRPSTIRAGHAPRSPHFERMGKERIYPFLCQMAKVEPSETVRKGARTTLLAWIWEAQGGQNGSKSTVSVLRKATPQAPPTLFGQSWKVNSPKFALHQFYEVELPLYGVLGSSYVQSAPLSSPERPYLETRNAPACQIFGSLTDAAEQDYVKGRCSTRF